MLIGLDASRAFGSFWGGPEAYSYFLLRAILKAPSNHQFRLYLRPGSSQSPHYQAFFSDLPSRNFQLSTLNFPLLWTQIGLALECFKNPPDVLFIPAHTLPIIRRSGLKTVITIHDLGAQFLPNYHKFPQKYYLNFATQYAVKNATKIIAVSQYTKKNILEKFKIQNSKIKTIYEGSDRNVFYHRSAAEIVRIKEKFGISESYFLFVGTIQPRKNLVRLIEAFANLVQSSKFPPEADPPREDKVESETSSVERRTLSLVFAGSPGWLNQEIYAAPRKFGVENQVKFLGPVVDDDLAALMSGATAFVFPSLFEGFGLAPLEAMACGVPVILAKTTSLPEVGGDAAFYVDPYSVAEISQKMKEVWDLSTEARGQLIERVKARTAQFSWEKAAAETLEVLESAAGSIN